MNDLRTRRKALGKTMGDIADRLGVSATYVSDAERYPELHPSKVKIVGDCLRELEAKPEAPAESAPASSPCIVCGVPISANTRDAAPWSFDGESGHKEGQAHHGCRAFIGEKRGSR